jgi:integrase
MGGHAVPLTLTRRKGSPYWYIRGTVRGKPVFESTGTDRRDAAETIRIRRETEILDRSVYGDRAMATFVEAVSVYFDAGGSRRFLGTRDKQTGQWSGLLGYFGETKLASIGQTDLDAAARKLYPNATPATRNRQVYTPFIAVWSKAAVRGLCDHRQWERPKNRDTHRSRWATVEEVERLVTEAAEHLAPLVVFLALTGARMSEALELEWGDVDLDAAWCVFRRTKRNQEPRGVPLHRSVVTALSTLRHRNGRVFLTNKGRPYRDNARLSGGQAKTGWMAMCRRAGVSGITPHTLRHTFSTWLTGAHVTDRIRDELMGHASSETGRRYAHVPRPELVEAVSRLPEIRARSVHSDTRDGIADGETT